MVIETRREKEAFIGLSPGAKAFEMQLSLDNIEAYLERTMTKAKGDQIIEELKGLHLALGAITLNLERIDSGIGDLIRAVQASNEPVVIASPVQVDGPTSVVIPEEAMTSLLIKCSSCGQELPEYEFAQSYVLRFRVGERKAIMCKKCFNIQAKEKRKITYWPIVLAYMQGYQIARGTPEALIPPNKRFNPDSFRGVFDGFHGTKPLKPGTILRLLTELSGEGLIAPIRGREGRYYVLYDDVEIQSIIDGGNVALRLEE